MKYSASTKLMRQLNSSAILNLIRESSPISRSQIARQLKISMPTVMRIVEDLLDEDLARWSGDTQASGGRPRSLLEFNGGNHAVVGLDLGGTKMFGTVADLCGNIQKEIYKPWGKIDPQSCLEQVCDLIQELLETPRPEGQRLRGIGVGAPGVTLFEDGIVTWAPSLGWRDLPLKRILEERFDLPAIVENDVNLAAMGEYGFGSARGAASLVCIAIGTGIGSGIVLNRQLYRGFNQSAGEVGYLPFDKNCLGQRYEEFGALESIASGSGIAQQAREILRQQGQPIPQDLDAEAVFMAARAGESWARQVVDETVDYLSLAVAAVSAILDPEVIVLGGGVARSADILIASILQRLDGVLPTRPNLVQSSLGSRAGVMGAIILVLYETTNHVAIYSLR